MPNIRSCRALRASQSPSETFPCTGCRAFSLEGEASRGHRAACIGIGAHSLHRLVRRGDDTVRNPHRAQISQFELFELFLLLKSDKRFSVEEFIAAVSQSAVPSPPLKRKGAPPAAAWAKHKHKALTWGLYYNFTDYNFKSDTFISRISNYSFHHVFTNYNFASYNFTLGHFRDTPSPPTKSFPTKSPRVELSGRLPITSYRHENSHPLELRVCLSQTL